MTEDKWAAEQGVDPEAPGGANTTEDEPEPENADEFEDPDFDEDEDPDMEVPEESD